MGRAAKCLFHSRSSRIRDMNSQMTYLVFEPEETGHHPSYLLHLLSILERYPVDGRIVFALPPGAALRHPELTQAREEIWGPRVEFTGLPPDAHTRFLTSTNLVQRARRQWRLLRHAVREWRPDRTMAMYVDHLLLPLALGFRLPTSLSGIYFRPTFHYSEFTGYRANLSDWIRAHRQRLLIGRALRSPVLDKLFCLDRYAVPVIERMSGGSKAIALPDPVGSMEAEKEMLADLPYLDHIDPDRKVFLFFGRLSRRKGLLEVLDALASIPQGVVDRICLLLVGQVEAEIEGELQRTIEGLQRTKGLQTVLINQFIPEREVPLLFQRADFVLAPYLRHVGMSGILVRSAAAEKPVISSDYGLMGELVRRRRLGIAIDTMRPENTAAAIAAAIVQPQTLGFDRDEAHRFARENSAGAFAEVLHRHFFQE